MRKRKKIKKKRNETTENERLKAIEKSERGEKRKSR